MHPTFFFRAAVAVTAAALAAPSLSAQQASFHGIAWGTSPDSVRSVMEGFGYHDVEVDSLGDLRFSTPSAQTVATFSVGRLVAVKVLNAVEARALDSRFAATADSLRAALGAPTDVRAPYVAWARGVSMVWVRKEAAAGDNPPLVTVIYQGPGLVDEMRLRESGKALPALPDGWLALSSNDFERFAIDTASMAARGNGIYRVRLRRSFAAVQPDPSGSFDTLILGWDVDCTRRRLQLRTRTAIRGGRVVRTDSGTTIWVPAAPGTSNAWELDIVCHYVGTSRSTPAGAAAPAGS
jgi:hypothetical protein